MRRDPLSANSDSRRIDSLSRRRVARSGRRRGDREGAAPVGQTSHELPLGAALAGELQVIRTLSHGFVITSLCWASLLAALIDRRPLHAALSLPLGARAVNLERTLASAATLRRLHAAGRAVGVWTVNAPSEAKELAAIGANLIITDAPGEVLGCNDCGPLT